MGPLYSDYERLIVLLVLRPLVQPLYPKINQVIFVVPVALPLTEEIQQLFKHEVLKDEEANIYRQVMFANKPEQIQSEVLLVYRNPDKKPISENLKVQSQIAPKKKQRVLVINHDMLCSEYQYSMLSGMSLPAKLVEKEKIRVLVLGTGAGLLPMFLRS